MSVTVVDDDIVRAHRAYRKDLSEFGYCVDCYEIEHDGECVSDEEAEDEY